MLPGADRPLSAGWWQLRAHVDHWFANALIPKADEPLPVLVTEMGGKRSFVEQGSA